MLDMGLDHPVMVAFWRLDRISQKLERNMFAQVPNISREGSVPLLAGRAAKVVSNPHSTLGSLATRIRSEEGCFYKK